MLQIADHTITDPLPGDRLKEIRRMT